VSVQTCKGIGRALGLDSPLGWLNLGLTVLGLYLPPPVAANGGIIMNITETVARTSRWKRFFSALANQAAGVAFSNFFQRRGSGGSQVRTSSPPPPVPAQSRFSTSDSALRAAEADLLARPQQQLETGEFYTEIQRSGGEYCYNEPRWYSCPPAGQACRVRHAWAYDEDTAAVVHRHPFNRGPSERLPSELDLCHRTDSVSRSLRWEVGSDNWVRGERGIEGRVR
jgi:hypothetical protein